MTRGTKGEERLRKIRTSLLAGMAVVTLGGASVCYAGAGVLPKGVYNVNLGAYYYGDITERYNQDGDKEKLAADFNGPLDSSVFEALQLIENSPLGPLLGGNPATFGDAVVDFEYQYRNAELKLKYGVTDNFQAEIEIPYFRAKNRVSARLNTEPANIGVNPLWETGADPFGSPFIPLNTPLPAGEVTPLTTEDILDLVSGGLDVNDNGTIDVPGFEFERFETWRDSGIGDIVLSGKYKFHDEGDWIMAVKGGVRLGTGDDDNPDNLVDLGFGDGQEDILFGFAADYRGVDKWLFGLELGYNWQLSDEKTMRVPEAVDAPVTVNKEKVDRDLGDVVSLSLSGFYTITPEWSTGLTYKASKKFEDDIDGDMGFNYSSLEDETEVESQSITAEVTYSTVQRFLQNKAKVPYSVGLAYRNRYDGSDNINNSWYVAAIFNLYFK